MRLVCFVAFHLLLLVDAWADKTMPLHCKRNPSQCRQRPVAHAEKEISDISEAVDAAVRKFRQGEIATLATERKTALNEFTASATSEEKRPPATAPQSDANAASKTLHRLNGAKEAKGTPAAATKIMWLQEDEKRAARANGGDFNAASRAGRDDIRNNKLHATTLQANVATGVIQTNLKTQKYVQQGAQLLEKIKKMRSVDRINQTLITGIKPLAEQCFNLIKNLNNKISSDVTQVKQALLSTQSTQQSSSKDKDESSTAFSDLYTKLEGRGVDMTGIQEIGKNVQQNAQFAHDALEFLKKMYESAKAANKLTRTNTKTLTPSLTNTSPPTASSSLTESASLTALLTEENKLIGSKRGRKATKKSTLENKDGENDSLKTLGRNTKNSKEDDEDRTNSLSNKHAVPSFLPKRNLVYEASAVRNPSNSHDALTRIVRQNRSGSDIDAFNEKNQQLSDSDGVAFVAVDTSVILLVLGTVLLAITA